MNQNIRIIIIGPKVADNDHAVRVVVNLDARARLYDDSVVVWLKVLRRFRHVTPFPAFPRFQLGTCKDPC